MTSGDSCRKGLIEGVEKVELEYAGRLSRMGCDSLLISVCGSVGGWEPLREQNGPP